jgi:hypothetical protein
LKIKKTTAYRAAHPSKPMPDALDPEIIYHALFPHPALSPAPEHGLSTVEQIKNEAVYRQLLVQGLLAVLLPTEDLGNPCLRTLVSDVIADMILGNGIGGKASSGWLMWDGIAKILEQSKPDVDNATTATATAAKASNKQVEMTRDGRSRLEKYGLLSVGSKDKEDTDSYESQKHSTISETFWKIIQHCYMIFLAIRFVTVGLLVAASETTRSQKTWQSMSNANDAITPIATEMEAPSSTASKRPILSYSIFGLVSQLLELRSRMPWMVGAISLAQYHLIDGVLQVGATEGMVNK